MSLLKGDLIGQKFGRLTVVKRGNPHVCPGGQLKATVVCSCICGRVCVKQLSHLSSGHTKSCGCFRGDVKLTHGKHGTKIHYTWLAMLARCNNPEHEQYVNYGGRGIKVCKRWYTIENFHADMGEPPKGMTLDRRDNDGDYCKSNCRWVSSRVQGNNRRTNVYLEFNGSRRTITQWASKLGIPDPTLRSRLRYKWSVERALTAPVRALKGVSK